MNQFPSDIAFTQSVKALQAAEGSREAYARMEQGPGWNTRVTPDLRAFLSSMDMFYLATANAEGQPYIQYRGGAPGFLKVIDDATLGFSDFTGNRQFISTGNLADNPKAFIFLMDYEHRRRVKLWGTAESIDDPAMIDQLTDPSYPGTPHAAILFHLAAWDGNCPQHIHPRILKSESDEEIARLTERIQSLESELASARGKSG